MSNENRKEKLRKKWWKILEKINKINKKTHRRNKMKINQMWRTKRYQKRTWKSKRKMRSLMIEKKISSKKDKKSMMIRLMHTKNQELKKRKEKKKKSTRRSMKTHRRREKMKKEKRKKRKIKMIISTRMISKTTNLRWRIPGHWIDHRWMYIDILTV